MIDHSSADESTLVAAANRGNAAAYEELYRRHAGWTASVARRLTGNEQDALDVLQEVFAYFWTRFPGFELRSTVRAFLYPVVKHTCVDIVRRRRRDATIEEHEEPGQGHQFELAGTPALEFLDLLKELPGDQREVVILRFAHDFRLGEIAEALEIPVGTVKSRLHNALLALRSRNRRKT